MIEHKELNWVLKSYIKNISGIREYVSVADIDEYCFIYKHELEYPVININGDKNYNQDVTYGFIPKSGNRSSSETKADSSGSLETTLRKRLDSSQTI